MRYSPLRALKRFLPIPSFGRNAPVDQINTADFEYDAAGGYTFGGSADTSFVDPEVMGASEIKAIHFPLPTPPNRIYIGKGNLSFGGSAETGLAVPTTGGFSIGGEAICGFQHVHYADGGFLVWGSGEYGFNGDEIRRQMEEEEILLFYAYLRYRSNRNKRQRRHRRNLN